MAHIIGYVEWNGERDVAPTVTYKAGRGAGVKNAPDDVMLLSVLLNLSYSRAFLGRLPKGATRLIVPGPKYTAETDLFLRDFQKDPFGDKRDGFASPLPPGAGRARLLNYTVFRLFDQAKVGTDNETIITLLAEFPYLSHLRRPETSETVQREPLSETVHGQGDESP